MHVAIASYIAIFVNAKIGWLKFYSQARMCFYSSHAWSFLPSGNTHRQTDTQTDTQDKETGIETGIDTGMNTTTFLLVIVLTISYIA